jgi:hypothetical protein
MATVVPSGCIVGFYDAQNELCGSYCPKFYCSEDLKSQFEWSNSLTSHLFTMSDIMAGPSRIRSAPKQLHKPYERTQKPGPKPQHQPKTSARVPKDQFDHHDNLTLFDWITIRDWYDEEKANGCRHSQEAVVKHFEKRKDSTLIFSQSALSRNLSKVGRAKLQERLNATPNALNTKRPRAVMRPDVDRALYLWVKHMESRGEQVTGPMLEGKRARFEVLFDVPQNERVTSKGWIAKFNKTYVFVLFNMKPELTLMLSDMVSRRCVDMAKPEVLIWKLW